MLVCGYGFTHLHYDAQGTERQREEAVHQEPRIDAVMYRAQMLLGLTSPVSEALVEPARQLTSFSPSATAGERERDGFRWEAEMTALVAGQVHRLMPRGGAHLVVGEVPAAQGIADIVGVRFDTDAIEGASTAPLAR